MNDTAGIESMQDNDGLLAQVTKIVAGYVSNNKVSVDELPQLIDIVYKSLLGLDIKAEAKADPLEPAVPVSESVFPDYIICLEDGKKLKMLKRHLRTSYGLSPEEYRQRWDLPVDYPMVSPNYAKHRQKLAKKIGLGKR